MSRVDVELLIEATPQQIWDVALDPNSLDKWVTIHRNLESAPSRKLKEGDEIVQTLALRGVPFKVKWTVESLSEPKSALWRGKGPAGSVAVTEYGLVAKGKSTLFRYSNEFIPPGGPLGRVAAGALVGGIPENEAVASLERLRALFQ